MSDDLYATLGVGREASQEEIKRAYRKLAKEMHPDLNPDKPEVGERFKQVTAAYDILSDPERRGATIGARSTRAARSGRSTSIGISRRTRRPDATTRAKGSATRSSCTTSSRACSAGAAAAAVFACGARRRRFLYLAGRFPGGGQRRQEAGHDGRWPHHRPDHPARRARSPDPAPQGPGHARVRGRPPGDAYVELHVQPHAYFERKDHNIHMDLPVSVPEAVLGGRVEVPTIDGPVTMTVPKGSNTGTTLRLRGRGVRDQKSGQRGDQYVRLQVALPKTQDAELEEFVRRWAGDHAYDPRAELRRSA